MNFEEHVQEGNAAGALRAGLVSAALWAVGISWSTAIRAIALLIVPDGVLDRVLAELLSATVVTFLAIGGALLVSRIPSCRLSRRLGRATPQTNAMPRPVVIQSQLAPLPHSHKPSW